MPLGTTPVESIAVEMKTYKAKKITFIAACSQLSLLSKVGVAMVLAA